MKRLAAIILSALLLFSFTACDFFNDSPEESKSSTSAESKESTTLDRDNTETDDSIFISQDEKNTWRSQLIYILSRCEIQDNALGISGSVAAGLMDLDFDNTPELILAYPGGSMGNAPLKIYDLNTGEKLDSYNASGNVYFYIAQKGEKLVILEEGAIRIAGADYVHSVVMLIADRASELDYLRASQLFSRSNEGEKITYKYKSEIVDQTKYDTLYQQFLTDYIKIEETQIQLVEWETLGKLEWKDFGFKEGVDPESRKRLAEKMADTLINSSQEFIDYNASGITMSKYPYVQNMYHPILDAYIKMATHRKTEGNVDGIVIEDYPELSSENFEALLTYTEECHSYGRGFFLYDINRDGIEEMVFSSWGGGLSKYYIEMVFTGDGNEAKLIGRFSDNDYNHITQIGDDGRIHCSIAGKGEGGTRSVVSFDKTGATEIFSYGISDYTGFYDCEIEWFKEENGEWVNITEKEYLLLEEAYAFNEIKTGFEFRYFFKFAPK